MKRQTLLTGSALLATTALSTVALAGTVQNIAADSTPLLTVLTPKNVSAQIFGGTAPESIVIGGTTTGAEFMLDFTTALTTTFDVTLTTTGAENTGSAVAVTTFAESTALGQTLQLAASLVGCTVQVLTDRILINDCLTGSAYGRIDVMTVSGLAFDEANGLATAGTSISLSGLVTDGAGGTTFETISSGAIITSNDSIEATTRAGTNGTLLNTATPAFATLTGPTTRLLLGSVNTSNTAAVGTDLSVLITAGGGNTDVTSFVELTITHGVLTDLATDKVHANAVAGGGAAITVLASNFNGNIASFTFSGTAQIFSSFDISVVFDGSTAVSAWSAGTLDVSFTAGAATSTAQPSVAGTLASLSRGGLGVQINTANSSVAGGQQFQSLVRIVNNGTVAGAATIVVLNDATGTVLGTYTSAEIAAGATLQLDMPTIESAAGITAAGQYGLSISGAFTGYAQHVMFNATDSLFVDLSGFRIGSGTNNP